MNGDLTPRRGEQACPPTYARAGAMPATGCIPCREPVEALLLIEVCLGWATWCWTPLPGRGQLWWLLSRWAGGLLGLNWTVGVLLCWQ